MKERQIPFSSSMARAILAGTKSQTRRLIKPQPTAGSVAPHCENGWWMWRKWTPENAKDGYPSVRLGDRRCPYGEPGSKLWVRERWAVGSLNDPDPPRAIPPGTVTVHYEADGEPNHRLGVGRWRQGMFMPRWASRITLEVTDVRVERLQDISEEDAEAEGMIKRGRENCTYPFSSAIDWYASTWDTINAKRAPWASSPWVWVVEFRRCS